MPKLSNASSINELASDSIKNSIGRPSTPLTNHSRYTPITPANVHDLECLFNKIFQENTSLELPILDQLKKVRKGAYKALTAAEIQRVTNNRLLEVAKEEKKRKSRKKGKDCGYGRVMGIEVLQQREQEQKEREFLNAWKEDFGMISLEVFMDSKATRKPRKKKEKALEPSEAPVSFDSTVLFDVAITSSNTRLIDKPSISSYAKGKGNRKALDTGLEPRKKLKGPQTEQPVARQEPEVRTRAGRAIKKTSKL